MLHDFGVDLQRIGQYIKTEWGASLETLAHILIVQIGRASWRERV